MTDGEKKAFNHGMAVAAAIVAPYQSEYAQEILGAAGMKTRAELLAEGVDEYDINILEEHGVLEGEE